MNINLIILKIDIGNWFKSLGKSFQQEFRELFKDIVDFIMLIKENTYDVLCTNYGTEIVNLLGLGLIFLLIMIIAMKIINR